MCVARCVTASLPLVITRPSEVVIGRGPWLCFQPRGWGERFGPLARARRDRSGAGRAVSPQATGARGAERAACCRLATRTPITPQSGLGAGRETQQIKIRTLRAQHPPRQPVPARCRSNRVRASGSTRSPSTPLPASTTPLRARHPCRRRAITSESEAVSNARRTTVPTAPRRHHCHHRRDVGQRARERHCETARARVSRHPL